MLVRLSKEESYHCEVLGSDTVKICEMQNFAPRLENKHQTRVQANIYGFKAEWAVAKLYGLPKTGLSIASDFGVDLWWNDTSIDVKFTNKDNGDLIFDTADKFKSRIAILVAKTEDEQVMNVVGWLGRKLFLEIAEKKDYGYGDRLIVTQEKLKPVESLWATMKKIEFNG